MRRLEAKKMKLVSVIIFIVQAHRVRNEPTFPPHGALCPRSTGDLV